jgi:hypothetical protein
MRVFLLFFTIIYVSAVALIDYNVLFSKPPGMNGFAYLLAPFLGWIGLPCACIGALFVSWVQKLRAV